VSSAAARDSPPHHACAPPCPRSVGRLELRRGPRRARDRARDRARPHRTRDWARPRRAGAEEPVHGGRPRACAAPCSPAPEQRSSAAAGPAPWACPSWPRRRGRAHRARRGARATRPGRRGKDKEREERG
jgi:hypothetical protein